MASVGQILLHTSERGGMQQAVIPPVISTGAKWSGEISILYGTSPFGREISGLRVSK